jgi:hypothetical protein
VLALSAPVDWEPLVAGVPDQPPDAVQLVAFVEVHDRVALEPLEMLVGLALSEIVGTGADTEIVTDWAALPPAPLQVSVNCAAAVRVEVLCEPLVALAPLQPPEAAQEAAFVDDQVRVDAAPLLTVVGFPVSVTVGTGVVTVTVTDWEALPPLPLQVNV